MKPNSFRMWCTEKWFEHKDELEAYKQPLPYTSQEYFQQYKFWLKREYQHQHQQKQVENLCESYFSLP